MATSSKIPSKLNTSDETSSEYYDDDDDDYEEIEKRITTATTTLTTSTTRPLTNTYNLLNRRTTKADEEFAFTEPSFYFPTKQPSVYYFFKTLPPKYDYFYSSSKDFRQTTRTSQLTNKNSIFLLF